MALDEVRAKFGKLFMELVGASILVFAIQVTLAVKLDYAAFAIGVALAVIIYVGGPISGAHYNPAVTLAWFIRGKISFQEGLLYWLFQLLGGFLGALDGLLVVGHAYVPVVGPKANLLQAFLVELIITALLCLVVLATCTSSKAENNQYYGFAIGLTVFAGTVIALNISGAAFNPAVAFGLYLVKGNLLKFVYILWIIVAQLLGALVGAAIYYLVDPEEFAHFAAGAHEIIEEGRALLPGK